MSKEDQKLENAFSQRKLKESAKAKQVKEAPVDLAPFVKRFTQAKLDQWKTEANGRQLIHLKADDHLAVLRPPTADDLGEYMMAVGTNGMSKAATMIMEELWLDGDVELIDNEDYFIAVFLQLNNILEGKKAEFFRA